MISSHHGNCHHHHEDGNEEGCEAKAALDEEVSGIGTQRTAGILKFASLVHDFAVARCQYEALVCCTCGEIGDKGPYQIACHNEQAEAYHKVDALVEKYLVNT